MFKVLIQIDAKGATCGTCSYNAELKYGPRYCTVFDEELYAKGWSDYSRCQKCLDAETADYAEEGTC